jgi:outer membrane protein assembly factor BamD (BamD/ComL family)
MKIKLLFLIGIFSMLSCNNKKKSLQEIQISAIDSIEKVLYATAANEPIDVNKGNIAVMSYINYVDSFPNDSLSEKYLFKAAEVANSIKQYKNAVLFFERYAKDYSNNSKAAAAMFLEAFIFENNLSKYGEAHKVYTKLIELYPKSKFAEDAAICIINLGKSPDELIKEFEAKNKKMN